MKILLTKYIIKYSHWYIRTTVSIKLHIAIYEIITVCSKPTLNHNRVLLITSKCDLKWILIMVRNALFVVLYNGLNTTPAQHYILFFVIKIPPAPWKTYIVVVICLFRVHVSSVETFLLVIYVRNLKWGNVQDVIIQKGRRRVMIM